MAAMNSTIIVLVAVFLQTAVSQSSSAPVNYCAGLADAISICEIETPSFTVLPVSRKAACLCGSTMGTLPWGPASFDGLASLCETEYASIDPTLAYDARELSGLCTSFAAPGQPAITSSNVIATSVGAQPAPQGSDRPRGSTNGGLFTHPPATSVSRGTSSSTANAAARVQQQGREVFGLVFAMGGVAVGGYMMA